MYNGAQILEACDCLKLLSIYCDHCVDAASVVCHQLGLLDTDLHAVGCGVFEEEGEEEKEEEEEVLYKPVVTSICNYAPPPPKKRGGVKGTPEPLEPHLHSGPALTLHS